MATKKKKKNKSLAIGLVSLVVLVILILFLVERNTIITNLKETRFFDRVFGATPEFVENHPTVEKNDEEATDNTITIKVQKEQKPEVKPEITEKKEPVQQTPAKTEEAKVVEKQNEVVTTVKQETEKKNTETKENVKTTEVKYTELQLCFVEIDSEGSVIRKTVKRSIPKNDSPLSTALKLLLEGPDSTKAGEKNCMTLIPAGTKLLGAKVQDGIAYLDFNENFEFNSYGVEGYNGQLMQIVYTATSFSTVKSVQFLIEGQKKEYLGSEGQWIGSPLSRGSF